MKTQTLRFGTLVAAMLALSLASATPALATVHVTSVAAFSDTLTVSLVSTGDAGWSHGNENYATCAILPSPGTGFGGWFNQDVALAGLSMADGLDADDDIAFQEGALQFSKDGVMWASASTFTSMTPASVATSEGLYGVTATGSDIDGDDLVTGAIQPAFGIDKTKPESTSDVVPVYGGGAAIVTIATTDTLSGVENLSVSVDDGPDVSYDAEPGSMFTVPVTLGPGAHHLAWTAFDNAGNTDSHVQSFTVRPIGFMPTVSLTVTPGKGAASHTVKFSGAVSALPTSETVTVTVQHWSKTSKKYVAYKTFTTPVPMYAGNYALSRKLTATGRYRARASFGGRLTAWHSFVVTAAVPAL